MDRHRRHARRNDHGYYSEGLQIPILKIPGPRHGQSGLVEIIRLNVRLPNRAIGDLRAQVTAVKTGERRFLELIERYGREPCRAHRRHHGPRRSGGPARTKTIPDGTYEAESFMDDDGVESVSEFRSGPRRVKGER